MPPVSGNGPCRTDMNCTNCNKAFVAELDFSISGNHVVECPYCGHEHCRVIKDGVITGDRWESRHQRVNVDRRSVWKSSVIQATTLTASEYIRSAFMRDLWLNRSDA